MWPEITTAKFSILNLHSYKAQSTFVIRKLNDTGKTCAYQQMPACREGDEGGRKRRLR